MRISRLVRAELALVLITVIWGSTFTIVKIGLAQVSPIFFVALRFWIAAAVVTVAMAGQVKKITRRTLLQGFLLSAALLGGFILQTLGLRDTTPSNSAFITSLCVLLVPVLGLLVYRRKPETQTVAGILVATIGLFLLLVDSSSFNFRSGDFLTLICAFLFACHILFLGVFVRVADYRQLMLVKMCCGAILCTIISFTMEKPYVSWDWTFTFYILVLGVLATATAFWVQSWAQQYSNPNHTALIFSLEPVFATFFALWILNQQLSAKQWLGSVFILGGVLVSELRRTGDADNFRKGRINPG